MQFRVCVVGGGGCWVVVSERLLSLNPTSFGCFVVGFVVVVVIGLSQISTKIGRFSTKKNIGSKHWKRPKTYFDKTFIFFNFLKGRGSFHLN